MQTTPEQLQHWLAEPEGVRLEFKEAKQSYHFDKLVEYCVALANKGGGKIIFGVTDRRLPALSRSQIQGLLRELRKEGAIRSVGLTKAARWYPGAGPGELQP